MSVCAHEVLYEVYGMKRVSVFLSSGALLKWAFLIFSFACRLFIITERDGNKHRKKRAIVNSCEHKIFSFIEFWF
jgi:hypothetical protein